MTSIQKKFITYKSKMEDNGFIPLPDEICNVLQIKEDDVIEMFYWEELNAIVLRKKH